MGIRQKPVVVQYNEVFHDRTETFIYHYVSNLRRFHPIYLATNFVNLEMFPTPDDDQYIVPAKFPKKFTPEWFYAGTLRRVSGSCSTPEEIIMRLRKARLIHAHFAPQGFFALRLRGALKIPVVTNFYGFDVSELPRDPEWARRYQTLFQDGELFLVEGQFMKEQIIRLGCPEHKIQIQRIAIPLQKIAYSARKAKTAGETKIMIFAGRFVEKKGLIYALDAVRILKDDLKNFELRIVGDGPLKAEIEEFIRKYHLESHVKLLGFLKYDDYLKEAGKADIFVQPSVTAKNGDTEGGAPTVILEAQAAGMPVIATKHADIPNIVAYGKSALLSDERDAEGLARNMACLLENSDSWETMGRAGRAFVEENHDIQKEIASLEEKYSSLIAK